MKFRVPVALGVLRNRDFRVYWAGQAVSLSGTWMQVMAQGWVVTALTTSATVLGALNVASTLPMLALAMLGGALADRFEKRRILIATQVGMMVLAFVFAGLIFSGQIALWQIFVMAFLLGIVTAFDLPAAQAFPPELVRRDEIPHAVALMQAIFHGSRLVGPAIAGVLVGRFGEGAAFLVNGISFIAVIATLVAIPDRRRASADTATPDAKSARSAHGGIGAGFRYVRGHRLVGSLIALTAVTMVFVFPFMAVLLVFYVRHVLHGEAQAMGALMSASGFGALAGSVTLLVGNDRVLRRWLVGGVAGCTVAIVGLSYVERLAPAIALILLLSFSVSALMGRISQAIQHVVPNELRGRVMAVFTMTFTGIMPYAALGLATAADAFGFARMLRLSGALYAVAAVVLLLRVPRASAVPEHTVRPVG